MFAREYIIQDCLKDDTDYVINIKMSFFRSKLLPSNISTDKVFFYNYSLNGSHLQISVDHAVFGKENYINRMFFYITSCKKILTYQIYKICASLIHDINLFNTETKEMKFYIRFDACKDIKPDIYFNCG